MHNHSLIAFNQINQNNSKRDRINAIKDVFKAHTRPLRDFDVLQILFDGESDMNLVRPRITELHNSGFLIESKKAVSPYGNRPVRTSIIRKSQLTLF